MGPIVVVTGAAGGVGRATVALFHEEGWHVVGIDRAKDVPIPNADQVIRADVGIEDDVKVIFEDLARLGHIDALVNNAAIQIVKPLVETTAEEWDAVMTANVRSAYLTIRAAYPLMRDHGGAVVNVSSVHAAATSSGVAAYATSKGALLALTRVAALELAPANIRVNAVLPGAIDTAMLHAGLRRTEGVTREAGIAALASRTPMRRVGQPREIAHAILFLADSTWSSFMTGQSMIVDGGAVARLGTE